jgi:hypothetical protein
MQPTLDIRRDSDGSIDFDFYRRRAKRRRRLARRMLLGRCLAAGGGLIGASGSAMARLVIVPSWRNAGPSVLARAGGRIPPAAIDAAAPSLVCASGPASADR